MKQLKSKKILNKITETIAELFSPDEFRCINCGREIFDEPGFCSRCIKEVVFNNGKTCKRCGVGLDGDEDYCGNCSFDKIYFDRSYAVFSYEGAIQRAILQMKFNNKGRYAKIFAKYLVFLADREKLEFDLVCYPPMSAKSRKLRFYNQSQLLAKHFCDILDKYDCLTDALVKIKETERQETLNKEDRRVNLVGSYKVNPKVNVKGKKVLIIDDVKTTGATLNECAKVLKRAGAVSVVGLMLSARKENVQFEQEL